MMNQICLIALDLDGTLLDSEKHLSEEPVGPWNGAPAWGSTLFLPRDGL